MNFIILHKESCNSFERDECNSNNKTQALIEFLTLGYENRTGCSVTDRNHYARGSVVLPHLMLEYFFIVLLLCIDKNPYS